MHREGMYVMHESVCCSKAEDPARYTASESTDGRSVD